MRKTTQHRGPSYAWSYSQVMQFARAIAGADVEFLERIDIEANRLRDAEEPIVISISKLWQEQTSERLIEAGLMHEDGSPKWPDEIKETTSGETEEEANSKTGSGRELQEGGDQGAD